MRYWLRRSNPDEAFRRRQRQWEAEGTVEAEAAHLMAQLRAKTLPPLHVYLAAILGNEASQVLVDQGAAPYYPFEGEVEDAINEVFNASLPRNFLIEIAATMAEHVHFRWEVASSNSLLRDAIAIAREWARTGEIPEGVDIAELVIDLDNAAGDIADDVGHGGLYYRAAYSAWAVHHLLDHVWETIALELDHQEIQQMAIMPASHTLATSASWARNAATIKEQELEWQRQYLINVLLGR